MKYIKLKKNILKLDLKKCLMVIKIIFLSKTSKKILINHEFFACIYFFI